MQKVNWTPIIITFIIVAGVLGGLFYSFSRQNPERVLEITGSFKVTAVPDQVAVSFQVQTKGLSAEKAKNENALISDRVRQALAAAGVEEEIETENFNIYEDCEYTSEGQKCKGYIASNSFKVKTIDVKVVGKIVDAGVNSGALVSYINYELSERKQNEYKSLALANAAKDAKTKAEAIVSGLGKEIGDLVSLSTSDYNYFPIPIYSMEAGTDVRKVATDLPPRSLEISASVLARYEIK